MKRIIFFSAVALLALTSISQAERPDDALLTAAPNDVGEPWALDDDYVPEGGVQDPGNWQTVMDQALEALPDDGGTGVTMGTAPSEEPAGNFYSR